MEPSSDGHITLTLGDGKRACRWDFDAVTCRAQFSADGSASKSLREGGAPYDAGNYAIENIRGLDKPFTVRMIIKGEPKWGGSLVDVEIAGQRTMITHRPGMKADNLELAAKGLKVTNLKLSPCTQ